MLQLREITNEDELVVDAIYLVRHKNDSVPYYGLARWTQLCNVYYFQSFNWFGDEFRYSDLAEIYQLLGLNKE